MCEAEEEAQLALGLPALATVTPNDSKAESSVYTVKKLFRISASTMESTPTSVNNSDLEDEGAEDAENQEEIQEEEGNEHAEEENGENSEQTQENDTTVQ
ncbi:hypothetical protein Dimus_031716 [Dionaea muscipula]